MTLQTSGPISLLDIQNEFDPANTGHTNIRLQDFYSGGGKVPTGTLNVFSAVIPSSGTISLHDFYGASDRTFPVNGTGITNYSQGAAGGTSGASVQFNADGSITHGGSGTVIAGSYSGPAQWSLPTGTGIGSGFELVVNSVSVLGAGGTTTAPSTGVWTTLGSSILFSLSNSGLNAPERNWNISIRDATSHVVLASFFVNIALENT
jgi:hypothetical protein